MEAQQQSDSEPPVVEHDETEPHISVCETCPGTVIFLESGNTDGWIATDSPRELVR